MKVGLISDVHGNSDALGVVLKALADEVDQLLFLGDLCGYYPFVADCIDLWGEISITGIRGNHDQILLDCLHKGQGPSEGYRRKYGSALGRVMTDCPVEVRSIIESWPKSREMTLGGRLFAMYHGAPWDLLEGRVYPDSDEWDRFVEIDGDVIVLGHTHHPFSKRHKGKVIVNPGSVGQPRDRASCASYATVDTAALKVEHYRIPFNPQSLIDDASAHDPDVPYLVEVLTRA
jgi:putative phosphoesterase